MTIKMSSSLIVYMVLQLFTGCLNKTTNSKYSDEIKGVILSHTISPSIGPGNKDLRRSDTLIVKIYFWKDQILYQTGHLKYYMKNGDEVLKTETEDFVFVQIQDSSIGYFYDLQHHKPVQRINKDSFFRYEWYEQIKLYAIFLESQYTLVSSERQRETLRESYKLKGIGSDTTKTGEITLVYTKKQGISKFSLSRELDSIKSMRLLYVKIINHPREFKEYNVKLPRFETTYNLEDLKDQAENKIFDYFIGYSSRKDHFK